MHVFALVAIMLFAGMATAQQRTFIPQPNTIYVGADGKFEAPPDTALVQFNISAQENSSKDAYERASRAAEQVRAILRSNGIDPKSAQIGFFSVQPVYDYRTPKRKLLGYRVNSSVTLKLKDFSKVSGIAEQLSLMDVTENQSVSYMLDDIEAAKVKAAQDAFQKARAEAAAVAAAGGRTLGELSYASVDTFEQPQPVHLARDAMAMRAPAAEAAPPTAEFSPHTITVTAHVNALFTMK
jgi:uncharacterized protein YggE